MKVTLNAALVLAGILVWAAPSSAADQTVRASGGVENDYGTLTPLFAPSIVSILPGESVTFVNDLGQHNVAFEDGQLISPPAPALPEGWPSPSPMRTFPQAGTYRFYCQLHGAPGGVGMSGRVVVGTAGGGGGGTGGGGTAPTTSPGAVEIESLTMPRRRFCNKRSRRCKRPGVRFKIDLSRAASLKGTLRRRPLTGNRRAKRFGTLDFGQVRAGSRTLSFRRTTAGRGLTSGRYVLTLKAGDDTGTLRFSVKG